MKLHNMSALLIVALAIGHSASAQNLVTNGSFETGDLTGWTVFNSGNTPLGGVSVETAGGLSGITAQDGSDYAGFAGGNISSFSSLSQAITTQIGDTYDFSFYLNDLDALHSDSQAGWLVYFGDIHAFSINGEGSELVPTFSTTADASVNTGWLHVDLQVVADVTDNGLYFQGDEAGDSQAIDNISVTDLTHPFVPVNPVGGTSSVPDSGGGLVTVALTLLGLCAARRLGGARIGV
jgi:hypothetical protein